MSPKTRQSLLAKIRRGTPVWMIEGIWSRNGNVYQREYTSLKGRVDSISKLSFICFTDGTTLSLNVYDVKRKDQLKNDSVNGYGELIDKCIKHGVNRVVDLPRVNYEAKP